MKSMNIKHFAFVLLASVLSVDATASGISVDAGLTPAEDRWILRTQLRYMQRNNDPGPMDRRMERFVWNNVLAYGLKRNLTLMVRQPFLSQDMAMAGTSKSDSGPGDLMVMAKYGIYRRNTAEYTLGLATTLGLKAPTGKDVFSSETWDLKPGVYMSWRNRTWSWDLSLSYLWSGFADDTHDGIDPGDELSLDLALARQFILGEGAEATLAPLVEISCMSIAEDKSFGQKLVNTGESVLFLSPGLKLTVSSFIMEALIQIPVIQDQEGLQPERDTGFITGIRYMF